ncbi:MAG: hypothetical protein UT66_C0041G0014 [candidate division CPR2 bacterium GW2011_GWC1_39_9]|uniref:HMA domain-containing protein n=1 Tax=candidate division CPR2 bacterium GW2011_GWC2_39_10 TaxID=1618345 RepID=A0A0G0LR23_UNCC2|nr:MAG: hypothetical protein UT18_C0019G0004 [candidate division CPR2 bacterium GW2011_GWC2_39_10]KKR33323.1 MAG: hypothetical protein UT66_C0041G0014 [candidate division CPR2 bacterium GW2011_GWC1_39_9]
MSQIQVVNIKCGGCEKNITESLVKSGLQDVRIDVSTQTVSFEGSVETAEKILTKMGYPKAGTPEAKKLSKKAKSFVSCAIGRIK